MREPYATVYGVPDHVFAVATIVFDGVVVTAETVMGFSVFQVSVVVHVLCHAGIVQFVAVSVPDGPGIVVKSVLAVYATHVVFMAYPR